MLFRSPRLRPEIDAAPYRHEGRDYYILHDASSLVPGHLVASPLAIWLVARLDGNASLLELHDRLQAEAGEDAPALHEMESIVRALEEACFLEGPRFDDWREQAARDFAARPERAATSAGLAYPDDPAVLAQSLDAWMSEAPPDEIPESVPANRSGDAAPSQPTRQAAASPARQPHASPHGNQDSQNSQDSRAAHPFRAPDSLREAPVAAVAPHIDYARGHAAYGQLYRELAKRRAPETVVALGVAHGALRGAVSVCPKDFALPGGVMKLDRERTEALAARGRLNGHDWLREAYAHHAEHSIELQAAWLRHIWPDTRLVPVLVSAPDEAGDAPSPTKGAEWDYAREREIFASILAEWLADPGKAMLLASVDLAHVGPGFGDTRPISEPFLEEVEEADRRFLAAIAAGGGQAAGRDIARGGNPFRLCGLGALDMLARALSLAVPEAAGRVLGYHQAATPELGQAVTFAAMVF